MANSDVKHCRLHYYRHHRHHHHPPSPHPVLVSRCTRWPPARSAPSPPVWKRKLFVSFHPLLHTPYTLRSYLCQWTKLMKWLNPRNLAATSDWVRVFWTWEVPTFQVNKDCLPALITASAPRQGLTRITHWKLKLSELRSSRHPSFGES